MTEALLCVFKGKACWHGREHTKFLSTSSDKSQVCCNIKLRDLFLCSPKLGFLLSQIKPNQLGIISICSLSSLEDGIFKISGLSGEN